MRALSGRHIEVGVNGNLAFCSNGQGTIAVQRQPEVVGNSVLGQSLVGFRSRGSIAQLDPIQLQGLPDRLCWPKLLSDAGVGKGLPNMSTMRPDAPDDLK